MYSYDFCVVVGPPIVEVSAFVAIFLWVGFRGSVGSSGVFVFPESSGVESFRVFWSIVMDILWIRWSLVCFATVHVISKTGSVLFGATASYRY